MCRRGSVGDDHRLAVGDDVGRECLESIEDDEDVGVGGRVDDRVVEAAIRLHAWRSDEAFLALKGKRAASDQNI